MKSALESVLDKVCVRLTMQRLISSIWAGVPARRTNTGTGTVAQTAARQCAPSQS